MMKRSGLPSRLRGYSLVELLVVLAFIGMFSLISVPPILSYMAQLRVRSATRIINSDIRAARQRAITTNKLVAFSFLPGDADPNTAMEKAQYAIFEGTEVTPRTTPRTFTWAQFGPTRYAEGVYFMPTGFPLTDAQSDDMADIIFRPNGTVDNMGNVTGGCACVEFRTEKNVTNNHVTDTFTVSGSFTTTLVTD